MCHLQMLTSCFYSRQPDKRSSRHGGMSNDCSMSNDSSSCCNQAPDCNFGMQALKDEISSLKTQSGHDLESATKEARKEAVRLLGEVSLHALHLQTRACVWVSAREHVRTYHLPAIFSNVKVYAMWQSVELKRRNTDLEADLALSVDRAMGLEKAAEELQKELTSGESVKKIVCIL